MRRRAARRPLLLLPALALAAAPGAAWAEDAVTVDLGVSLTSNYLFRGLTQTDDKPAVQPWIEAGWNGFYASVFASNVDFGRVAAEIDPRLGYRGTLGEVTWDLSVARFFYTDTGDCCGEVALSTGWAASERVLLGAELHYDRGNADRYGALTASVGLGAGFYVSGAAGAYLEEDADADFNLGVGRDFGEGVALDLRVHDTSRGPWRVNATLSFATDWATLNGR